MDGDSGQTLKVRLMTNPAGSDAELNGVIEQAVSLVLGGDLFAAQNVIEEAESAQIVVDRYSGVIKLLYRDHKDVAGMLTLGALGVAFCLREARSHENSSDESRSLLDAAKRMSFNIAANCWPGWNDEGVEISDDHIRTGLGFARLSRRLVEELELDGDQVGNGYWIVGALQLSLGEFDAALAALADSKAAFGQLSDPAQALMADAYIALTKRLDPASESNDEELKSAVQTLRGLDNEDATFFVDQVETARAVFQLRLR